MNLTPRMMLALAVRRFRRELAAAIYPRRAVGNRPSRSSRNIIDVPFALDDLSQSGRDRMMMIYEAAFPEHAANPHVRFNIPDPVLLAQIDLDALHIKNETTDE